VAADAVLALVGDDVAMAGVSVSRVSQIQRESEDGIRTETGRKRQQV
jgi:hypothetical protein